mgnify:CR=1 FL=1
MSQSPKSAPISTLNYTSNNASNNASIKAPTPVTGVPEPTSDISYLLALMARLRADCPWDIKQTNHSLIPYAIEEAYELAEAIQEGDIEDIKGELGDVLLQVIFHCQIYAEQQQFDLGDVIYTLQSKLIRRHPHVFEADKLPDEAAVKKRWDEIKALENAERERRGKPKRSLDAIKAGSALMQAQSLQQAASKLGFDWEGVAGAIEKLEEEISELKQILPQAGEKVGVIHKQELEKELGDCIFGLVNVARKLNLDAEAATLTCVHKFRSRFGFIEAELAKQGKTAQDSSLEEMDALWELAKQHE